MKSIGVFLLVVLVIVAIVWSGIAIQYGTYAFWAPKMKSVERKVFEETPSYVHGNIQELENMQIEYLKMKADKKDKEASALAAIIIHRAAGLNPDILTPDLKAFVSELKENK